MFERFKRKSLSQKHDKHTLRKDTGEEEFVKGLQNVLWDLLSASVISSADLRPKCQRTDVGHANRLLLHIFLCFLRFLRGLALI